MLGQHVAAWQLMIACLVSLSDGEAASANEPGLEETSTTPENSSEQGLAEENAGVTARDGKVIHRFVAGLGYLPAIGNKSEGEERDVVIMFTPVPMLYLGWQVQKRVFVFDLGVALSAMEMEAKAGQTPALSAFPLALRLRFSWEVMGEALLIGIEQETLALIDTETVWPAFALRIGAAWRPRRWLEIRFDPLGLRYTLLGKTCSIANSASSSSENCVDNYHLAYQPSLSVNFVF
ncbi:MAG: hypothetical protein GY854_19475 [Deltaproteobacteria bacterium]|nr:hypothetical protein [Deltaproteobacteria bacterium]